MDQRRAELNEMFGDHSHLAEQLMEERRGGTVEFPHLKDAAQNNAEAFRDLCVAWKSFESAVGADNQALRELAEKFELLSMTNYGFVSKLVEMEKTLSRLEDLRQELNYAD